MKIKEKVTAILNTLETLFPHTEPPLHHHDAYTLLISVLLSARCTDARVNQVTPQLFARADNPKDMMDVPVEEIREIIRPCGLSPTKARGIQALSAILTNRYGGQVPNSFQDLETLPSVGHKTASVVMAQWFGIPAFPVDTHVHRLAFRWGLSKGTSVVQTERDLKRLIPSDQWIYVHLRMIYFGRMYCPARGHRWNECPICKQHMPKKLRKTNG